MPPVSEVDPEELALEDSDLVAIEAPVPKALGTVRRLGRYVLSHEIASGGMATVHLARAEGHGGFEKVLAIKSMHAHLAKDPAFVAMFMDEARLASRIDHPNVCRVFDFGHADGTHYMVMEYVVGETLAALYQRAFHEAAPEERPRLSRYAARILAEACEGLHAAHELTDDAGKALGIVHRDISPHNLFVCYDGTVRLIDFGVAKAAGRAQHTKTGVLKGKVAYMPPEQLRRRPLDRRADLWAMGVVLWELTTGKRLFRRDSDIETVLAIDQDAVPPPSEVAPTLPKELDPIVLRALAKEPDDRYPTAREMARDLHRYAARGEDPVGVAEIGEWMKSLFGAARDQRLKAVDEARGTISEQRTRPEVGEPTAPTPPPSATTEPAILLPVGAPIARREEPAPLDLSPPIAPPPPFDLSAPAEHSPPRAFVPPVLVPTTKPAPREGDPDAEGTSLGQRVVTTGATVLAVLAVGLGLLLIVLQLSGARGPRVTLVPSPTTSHTAPPATHEPTPSSATSEPAETPRPAARSGFVNVATPGGWAEVYVAGELRGTSPTRLTLPVGRHTIELRPRGGPTRVRRSVEVRAGAEGRLVVPIE